MKINYLLYSVAFASAFAACSDELTEVANAPVNEAVAGRPSAGNVALSINNGTQTRLNATGTGFTVGDQVKLFLMDEFNLRANGEEDAVASEEWNANLTPFWSQDRWFKMYNMVDYVQTNYIYDYDEDSGNFYNNAAQLVEGNYIAYYQENQDYRWHEITNRQDLWAYINPNVELKMTQKSIDNGSKNVYANMENDIYLDYQQFYRLEEAGPEGKLVKKMKMKPVLNRVKFTIGNLNNAPYRIKRIVIKKANQEAVPTLAYIRPYSPGYNEWNNDVMNDNLEMSFADKQSALNDLEEPAKSVAQAEFDNKFTKHEVYDGFAGNTVTFYTYNGGKEAFTQADARAITYFETPANGRIPFGLKKGLEAPAFEYTLEFPDGGHILNAQAPYTKTERVDVFAAVPVFADQFAGGDVAEPEYEIIVEGDYLDITKGEPSTPGYAKDGTPMWVPGYWKKETTTGTSNTNWKMEQAFEHDWTEALGQNWPTGTLTLDYHDMYLYEEGINTTAVTVSSTEQLLEAVKASATYGDRVAKIELNGIGIELTQQIADSIAANAAAYKLAHPLPAPQYEVNFTVSAQYAVSGAQFDNTTTDLAYNNNGAADSELDPMGHFNFNTVLVVTAKDVFALPTNIQTVSATYVADQTANKEITFGTKTIFAPGATLTVNKKVKASENVKIVFTNNTTIVLNNTLENAYIIPSATVEVKGTGTIKGNNLGRVSLPAQNIKKLNEDGVTYTELGFNDVLTHSDLVNATSAVKLFKAENRKVSIVGSTATYSGNDTTEDYELVADAANVTVAKNIDLFTEK